MGEVKNHTVNGWSVRNGRRNNHNSLILNKPGRPPLEIEYEDGMDPEIALQRVLKDAYQHDVDAAKNDEERSKAEERLRDAKLAERLGRLMRRAEADLRSRETSDGIWNG